MPFLTDHELVIPGTWNARDIGGRAYPEGETHALATGILYRSASLSAISDAGVGELERLNVTTVLDLRGEDEIARDGADVVPSSTRVVSLPFGNTQPRSEGTSVEPQADADMTSMIASMAAAEDPVRLGEYLMKEIYRGFIVDPEAHSSVGTALRTVAQASGATLVHCSAGKDRTGWIVALVQTVCGVSHDDVLQEYLLSAHAASQLGAVMPPAPGMTAAAWDPILTVKPSYLDAALSELVTTYGTITSYLDAIGVTEEIRREIRARFGFTVMA